MNDTRDVREVLQERMMAAYLMGYRVEECTMKYDVSGKVSLAGPLRYCREMLQKRFDVGASNEAARCEKDVVSRRLERRLSEIERRVQSGSLHLPERVVGGILTDEEVFGVVDTPPATPVSEVEEKQETVEMVSDASVVREDAALSVPHDPVSSGREFLDVVRESVRAGYAKAWLGNPKLGDFLSRISVADIDMNASTRLRIGDIGAESARYNISYDIGKSARTLNFAQVYMSYLAAGRPAGRFLVGDGDSVVEFDCGRRVCTDVEASPFHQSDGCLQVFGGAVDVLGDQQADFRDYAVYDKQVPSVASEVNQDAPGYCYLRLFEPKYHRLLVPLLRARPFVRDVIKALPICGRRDAFAASVDTDGDGRFHVCTDSADIQVGASDAIYSRLLQIAHDEPYAVLGHKTKRDSIVSLSVGEEVKLKFQDLKSQMRGAVSRDALVVFVHVSDPGLYSKPQDVQDSRAVEFVRPSWAAHFDDHAVNLAHDGLFVVCLNKGDRAVCNGVRYGSDERVVYIFARHKLDVTVKPVAPVDVYRCLVLTAKDFNIHPLLDGYLSFTSTEARFMREVKANLVLLGPVASQESFPLKPAYFTEVTDPLDTWKSVGVKRCNMVKAASSDCWRYVAYDIFSLSAFLSDNPGCALRVLDCVEMYDDGAQVAFLGSVHMCVVSSDVGEVVKPSLQWSVRVSDIADEYCMDRGGPSGSDFSDAL